ncbi:Copia protein [Dufourea novaeangliae]|uniref:Copia protein n=1 Tax=Dufourea novaeangliae TaxID=178035 RepID=A0A154PSK3_DUFNO|nr:Copia protein [Dufourea novaeangliae]
MILRANEDKTLWGEAIRIAAYLHNKSPTKVNKLTAYEMWNGKRPNLKHLRTFGCTVLVKDLRQVSKLDNRGKIAIFVGYTQTGYRLWDQETRKLIISRDVHFGEGESVEQSPIYTGWVDTFCHLDLRHYYYA